MHLCACLHMDWLVAAVDVSRLPALGASTGCSRTRAAPSARAGRAGGAGDRRARGAPPGEPAQRLATREAALRHAGLLARPSRRDADARPPGRRRCARRGRERRARQRPQPLRAGRKPGPRRGRRPDARGRRAASSSLALRRFTSTRAPSEIGAYLAALAPLLPNRALAIDAGTGDVKIPPRGARADLRPRRRRRSAPTLGWPTPRAGSASRPEDFANASPSCGELDGRELIRTVRQGKQVGG